MTVSMAVERLWNSDATGNRFSSGKRVTARAKTAVKSRIGKRSPFVAAAKRLRGRRPLTHALNVTGAVFDLATHVDRNESIVTGSAYTRHERRRYEEREYARRTIITTNSSRVRTELPPTRCKARRDRRQFQDHQRQHGSAAPATARDRFMISSACDVCAP